MGIRFLTLAAILTAALALGGCAYNTPVAASPNLNVYTSYSNKIPGRFALIVDSEAFNTTVRPTGLNCSAHHYPLDMRDAFKSSAAGTLRTLVEDVQILERPLPVPDLARQGYAGQVVVNAETMNARLQIISGFWSNTADSVVELSAGMTVDTVAGRVLGTSAQGFGNAQNDAGMMCGDAATAIGTATEKALRQLLGQLGERLSNSDRLRQAATQTWAPAAPPPAQLVATPLGDREAIALPSPPPPSYHAPPTAPPTARRCGMIPKANGGVSLVPC